MVFVAFLYVKFEFHFYQIVVLPSDIFGVKNLAKTKELCVKLEYKYTQTLAFIYFMIHPIIF